MLYVSGETYKNGALLDNDPSTDLQNMLLRTSSRDHSGTILIRVI